MLRVELNNSGRECSRMDRRDFLSAGTLSLGGLMLPELLAAQAIAAGGKRRYVNDKNNPGMVKGMNMLGPTLDRSVSAFLEDVEDRGLSEKILLVIVGDFGRSPKIGKNSGRGHWAKLCPLVFAGGGLQMGQVIGESNEKAEVPATDPISPADMMATVMHTMFDVGAMRLDSSIPRNISQHIERGKRIEELF